jgi:hypothetical protein
MIKKLLFILFLSISTIGFSQEKSIEKLSAAPNPFTNSTKITFNSTSNSEIIFKVLDVLGKTVYEEKVKASIGSNSLTFEKGDLLACIRKWR